jgi:CBS domain-containing protein
MKISDLMTNSVACVRENESLGVAARLMWERDCGAVPVVDEASGQVVGMITDRDICMAAWSRDETPSEIPISEIMSRDIVLCAPWDSISAAEELMRSKQVRRIPITDDGRKLVGILSLADIVTHRQSHGVGANGGEPPPSEILSTLADICQRRQSAQSSESSQP